MRHPHQRPNQVMLALWRAQGKCCGVCGGAMVPMSFSHPRWGWTVEHVWPRARYAYCSEGNRFISHAACNNLKADRDPTPDELALLATVNAALGHELLPRMLAYRDDTTGPTAFQVAFAKVRTA